MSNGTKSYVFPVCSSFVGRYWRSINYNLLSSYSCWYCVLWATGLRTCCLPSSIHQGFCCARMDIRKYESRI